MHKFGCNLILSGLYYYKIGNYMGSYTHNKEVFKYIPDDNETLNNVRILKGMLHEQVDVFVDRGNMMIFNHKKYV